MSKLEELIKELCPDGVEYKSLVEICQAIRTGKLNANAMVDNGKYPFFTCDAQPFKINTYAFDTVRSVILIIIKVSLMLTKEHMYYQIFYL